MFNNRFFMPLVEGYHPSYRAVLQRASSLGYTLPSLPASRVLNKCMVDLVNTNCLSELDCLWIYMHDGNNSFGTINWVNPSANQNILVNSPTWTSKKGFESNGTNSYINSGFAPATQGVKYTKNSASIGAFVTDSTTLIPGTFVLTALLQGSNHVFLGRNGFNNSRLTVRINDDLTDLLFNIEEQYLANTMYSGKRTSSTALGAYIDGSVFNSTNTRNTLSIPTGNIYILARNSSGSPAFYMPPGVKIGAVFYGSGNLDHLALYTALSDLNSAL